MGANIKVVKLHSAKREDEVHRMSVNLFNKGVVGETRFASCDHGTYLTGGKVQPHQPEHLKEIFYFTRGTGIFTLDGKEIPIKAGSAFVVPPRSVHSIVNTGDDILQHVVCSTVVP